MPAIAVCDRIRKLRLERGWSLEYVSGCAKVACVKLNLDHVGWTPPSISRMERGKQPIDSNDLQVFALVFGTAVSDLYDTDSRSKGDAKSAAP